jgi:hypothetical protein
VSHPAQELAYSDEGRERDAPERRESSLFGTRLGQDAITAKLGEGTTRQPAGGQSSVSSRTDSRWLTWIERADESDIWLMTLDEEPPP